MSFMKFNGRILIRFLGYFVSASIFYFLFTILADRWAELRNYEFHFYWPYLVISLLLFLASSWSALIIIRFILLKSGFKYGWLFLNYVISLSQMGKYLPGGIWPYVLRFNYLKDKVPKKIFLTILIYESIILVLSGVLVASLIIREFFPEQIANVIFLLILLSSVIYILMPKIFYSLTNKLLLKMGRQIILPDMRLKKTDLFIFLLIAVGSWCLRGVGFYYFVSSFVNTADLSVIWFVNVFAASVTLGYFLLVTPSGLGIREGFLVYFFSKVFVLEIATIISIATRIWIILGEVLLIVIAFLTYPHGLKNIFFDIKKIKNFQKEEIIE